MAFSRFEFALMENGYVRNGGYGQAEADWPAFRGKYAATYLPDAGAKNLLEKPANQQVQRGTGLEWKDLDLTRAKTLHGKVILVIKTIRNDWNDPVRTKFLLSHGVKVLDDFANLAGFIDDSERRY